MGRILKESALPNCYALCCPVFSLICLDRTILSAVEEWLVKQEPNERPKIQNAFACLFKNVEFKINESMRTAFTSNVTKFKEALNGRERQEEQNEMNAWLSEPRSYPVYT